MVFLYGQNEIEIYYFLLNQAEIKCFDDLKFEIAIKSRPPHKFASERGFEGDTERRTGTHFRVREDSSTGSTYKSSAEVEFVRRSSVKHGLLSHISQLLFAWTGKQWDVGITIQPEILTLRDQLINEIKLGREWKLITSHFRSVEITDILLNSFK
ncbi:palindromic element RPE1 domain-containing protein [Candidatus Trichorickettsia mobilis]|uniref:palindromic element RPE1 domain-containing protein n=1 Tax=Candidatus Trichorickettsia mobilis TaxID=1346319 RepID=UPI0029311860|nr:palindromic element RPE1 domain-containing protein [Candidatus Trichorickettsia mobilis]